MALGLRRNRFEPLTEHDLAVKIHRQGVALHKTLATVHDLGMTTEVKRSRYYPDGILEILDEEIHSWIVRKPDGRPH